jgi:hypothetical protein
MKFMGGSYAGLRPCTPPARFIFLDTFDEVVLRMMSWPEHFPPHKLPPHFPGLKKRLKQPVGVADQTQSVCFFWPGK